MFACSRLLGGSNNESAPLHLQRLPSPPWAIAQCSWCLKPSRPRGPSRRPRPQRTALPSPSSSPRTRGRWRQRRRQQQLRQRASLRRSRSSPAQASTIREPQANHTPRLCRHLTGAARPIRQAGARSTSFPPPTGMPSRATRFRESGEMVVLGAVRPVPSAFASASGKETLRIRPRLGTLRPSPGSRTCKPEARSARVLL